MRGKKAYAVLSARDPRPFLAELGLAAGEISARAKGSR
jgi:hypothetical protein